ncbi:MAG TPA: hypothetical protein PLA97_07180 [Rubrivivax sp.]|nr:hypothetical protein [Rubrivivax sp.]
MRASFRFSHWGRRSTLQDSSSLRVQVCPPSLRHAPPSLWQRLVFWMMAPAPQDASPPLNRLPLVRAEFLRLVQDITSEDADRLRWRIGEARSLRELWHLRADTYRVVGVSHSQTEAERRLTQLNRHFPTRAPRSQFAPL